MRRLLAPLSRGLRLLMASPSLRRTAPHRTHLRSHFPRILAVLLSTFNFLPRDADIQLEHRAGAITRPIVLGEEELGCRMPLRVRVLRD